MGIVLISAYFASLSPLALFRALPGSIAQGLIWGLLALGVYITYKLLDFADLSVDGSFATGGAVAVMLIRSDMNPWVSLIFAFAAGMLAGMVTGLLHTKLGIPPILAGILTQIALYSINLNIMGQSNQAISVDKYSLAVSLRYVSGDTAAKIKVFTTCILFGVVIVAILYWYFGTEQGHAIRATGCNPQMARAQGINTSFCKVLALMISNGLVGLSGALYAQYQGAADVKNRHFSQQEKQEIDECQHHVYDIQNSCCCTHFRHQLVHIRSRTLRTQQMHGIPFASLSVRRKCQKKYKYPHATQPVAETPPVHNSGRKCFHISQNRRTCGCKSRYNFKQGIDKVWNFPGKNKWQTPEKTDCNPASGYADHPFPRKKTTGGISAKIIH